MVKKENQPDRVKFQAKIGDWVCIKKNKFTEDTEDIEAARFLSSVYDSFKRKIWDYVGSEIDLDELDEIAYDITGAEYDDKKDEYRIKGRVTKETMSNAIQDLKNKAPRRIGLKNNELREIAKVYLTRKVLDLLKIRIDPDPDDLEKYVKDKRVGKVQEK